MWMQRTAKNRGELRPITTPEDFISSVMKTKSTDVDRHVTAFQKKLFAIKFPEPTGNNIFEKLENFRRLHGHGLSKLVEHELLSPSQVDPPSSSLKGLGFLRKNERLSTDFQNTGYAYFKAKNFDMALRCYTLAASFAPPESHVEKLAYSNRSACFVKLGLWKKCLEDIALFEKIEPGSLAPALLEKIDKRKSRCLEVVRVSKSEGSQDDKRYAKELFYTLENESKTIPGAEEFVGIREEGAKGRCLYNKGDTPIEPGTLILLDKSYFHAVWGVLFFERENCNACFRELHGGGIPCPTCVFHLYCSETCKASDFANSHCKYECKVLPYLHELKWDKPTLMHMDVSILLKLGPQGLLNHLRQSKRAENSIAGFDSEGVYNSSLFETVGHLSWNELTLGRASVNDTCIFALVATKVVDEATDYFSSLKEIDPSLDLTWVKDEFSKLLIRLKLILQTNCSEVSRMSPPPESNRASAPIGVTNFNIALFGYGVFPVASLLNHSCDPNVKQISLPDGRMAVITTQHVAPGQEFHREYNSRFPQPKKERQLELRMEFGFICRCTPCNYNWVKTFDKGNVCPACRPRRDIDSNGMKALTEIVVNIRGSQFSCPVCPWRMEKGAYMILFNRMEALVRKGLANFDAMRDLKNAFLNLRECVKFADLYFMKPNDFVWQNQKVMIQTLLILANELWSDS